MSQFTKIYKELVEKLKKDDIWKEVSIPKVLWKENMERKKDRNRFK